MPNETGFADHLRTTFTTIYFVGPRYGMVKIGKADNLRKRISSLQIGCVERLDIFAAVDAHPLLERHYHTMFSGDRQRGEWFKRSPAITAEINRLSRLPAIRGQAKRLAAHRSLLAEWGIPDIPVPAPIEAGTRMLLSDARTAAIRNNI